MLSASVANITFDLIPIRSLGVTAMVISITPSARFAGSNSPPFNVKSIPPEQLDLSVTPVNTKVDVFTGSSNVRTRLSDSKSNMNPVRIGGVISGT